MATRREFLVTTLALSALPPPLIAGSREGPATLQVISETLCTDGRAFSRSCDRSVATHDHDPATLLFTLEAGLASGAVDTIIGLTRPSTRFLVEQCAVRFGCAATYHAHHEYSPGTLVHALHAPAGVNSILKRRLLHTPRYWARTLANSLDVIATGTGPQESLTLRVPASHPARPRHLVSWVFQRKPA